LNETLENLRTNIPISDNILSAPPSQSSSTPESDPTSLSFTESNETSLVSMVDVLIKNRDKLDSNFNHKVQHEKEVDKITREIEKTQRKVKELKPSSSTDSPLIQEAQDKLNKLNKELQVLQKHEEEYEIKRKKAEFDYEQRCIQVDRDINLRVEKARREEKMQEEEKIQIAKDKKQLEMEKNLLEKEKQDLKKVTQTKWTVDEINQKIQQLEEKEKKLNEKEKQLEKQALEIQVKSQMKPSRKDLANEIERTKRELEVLKHEKQSNENQVKNAQLRLERSENVLKEKNRFL